MMKLTPPILPPSTSNPRKSRKHHDPIITLAANVSGNLEEGDFKGAVRLAGSEDTIADMSDSTFASLQSKHPTPHPDTSIPPPPHDPVYSISVSVNEVAKAIRSFPNGSAGGPDCLRPQRLKDLMGPSSDSDNNIFLSALASFLMLVLDGRMPPSIYPPLLLWCHFVCFGQEQWRCEAYCCWLHPTLSCS